MVLFPYFIQGPSAPWVYHEIHDTLRFTVVKMRRHCQPQRIYLTDYGVTWRKGDSLLQLPSYMPTSVRAQAVVFPVRYPLCVRSVAVERMPVEELRVPAALMSPGISTTAPRPVEDWDCPFIYLFRRRESGLCHDTVWRGVIKPYDI